MGQLNPRIVRVGIEVSGNIQVYEDLDISVRGTKTANPIQNTCEITVSNLAKATRNYLLTETSPFNANRTPKRVFVEVGRRGVPGDAGWVSRIFVGEIVATSPSQPPDIGLTFKAKTGNFSKGLVVSRSGRAQQSLSSLAAQVADDLGLALDFHATDRQVANYSFTGAALKQVEALERSGHVDAYVDDDTLVVKDANRPLPARSHKLSPESGLIGAPEATERGVRATFFLDEDTVLGGALSLTSPLTPSLDGEYTIYGLEFVAQSRGQAFYWIAQASRDGYNP